MNKKKTFILLIYLFPILCFAEPKFYKTKNGYSGYAKMYYQGTTAEWNPEEINQNVFICSNAFGYLPVKKNKLSNAQWAIFWAAFYDQYDVQKNEIYNMTIKVSGDSTVLHITFYDDGDNIVYWAFVDLSIFP